MKQCFNKMPEGPTGSMIRKVTPPKQSEIKSSMEALIHNFKLFTEGFYVRVCRDGKPESRKVGKVSLMYLW